MPVTVNEPVKLPLLPIFNVSPILVTFVGSPTIQPLIISDLPFNQSTTFFVPLMALPSSSLVMIKEILPNSLRFLLYFKKSETAAINAAIPDFMSAAPLPQTLPSFTSPPKGFMLQLLMSPVGTTST